MKSPYKAELERILRQRYAPAEPLAAVTIDDAGEFATLQIADKYERHRLSQPAKEFLRNGAMFWVTGEELLLPLEKKAAK